MRAFTAMGFIALLLPSLQGCYSCLGSTNQPGCAAGYKASRVAVHQFDALPEPGASVSATGGAWKQVTGSEDLGTDWAIAAVDGLLVLGLPELGAALPLGLSVVEDGCTWNAWDLDVVRSQEVPQTLNVRRTSAESGCTADAVEVALWLGDVGAGTSVGLGDVDGEDDNREVWLGNASGALDRGTVRLLADAITWPPLPDGQLAVQDPEILFELQGARPGDRLGDAIMACGDLDGGGRPDWVITAPGTSALPEPEEGPWWGEHGAVWILLGEELPTVNPRVLVGAQVGDALGTSATCTGDLSGDGLPDLVVGAPYAGLDESGEVYVVSGASVAGLAASTAIAAVPGVVTLRVGEAWSFFGTGLATGDLLGDDGLIDLAIGAAGRDDGLGATLLLDGRSSGDVTPDVVLAGVRPSVSESRSFDGLTPHFGEVVAVGDVVGFDGLPEVVSVGSRASVRDSFHAGSSQVFTDDLSPAFTIDGVNAYALAGRRLLVADIDGLPVLGEDGVQRLVDEVVLTTHRRPNQ